MIGSGSILSDVDITIDNGDELVNPFNLLDVQSIKLDPSFNELFENIDLEKLYNERYDKYVKYSDYIIKNNDQIKTTVEKILGVYYENISN